MKKMVKRVAASLLAVLAGCSMFLCAACEFDTSSNGDKTTLENSSGNQTDVNVDQGAGNGNSGNVQKPAVQKPKPAYEGTIVSAGGEYAFTSKIAFLSDELEQTEGGEESTYEPVSVTLKATVLPADANQGVTWTAEFVNPESEWASGKSVNDYIIVVPQDVSRIVDVTCKAPFGEQIKIICTSVENEEASASCTVDFMQVLYLDEQNVSLQFGEDLPINFGGTTDVTWELNPSGGGIGGAAQVNVKTSDVYTITESYTWDIDLIDPAKFHRGNWAWNDSWGTLEEEGSDDIVEGVFMDNYFKLVYVKTTPVRDILGNIIRTETEDVVVDYGLLRKDNISYLCFNNALAKSAKISCKPKGTGELFGLQWHFSDSSLRHEIVRIEEGSLWTLQLNINIPRSNETKTFESLINITEFTNAAKVQSVVLDNSNLLY